MKPPVVHYNSRLARLLLRPRDVAFTFGRHIFVKDHVLHPALVRHELVHVEQFRRLGTIRFLATYAWYSIKYGYRQNPLEVEARSRATLDSVVPGK